VGGGAEKQSTTQPRGTAPLVLAFDTKPLRDLCESAEIAENVLGAAVANALRRRLADLRAAESARDLVVGHPRPLREDSTHEMVIDIDQDVQLVFRVNHPSPPMTSDGAVDWARVNRVKILLIGPANV
jgi:hypothetical protein